ncbi:hypothetical protein WJX81_001020 [Elliptochloris bilobata]|uniref:FAD-binding domain-containing protein n=1 Tax=Elliptochloris bilobata TaxID=381761 RepID=A0AAW1SI99_9CHLO
MQARASVLDGAATENSVVVVGGGIGGLAAAVGLTKVGIPVTVLERAASLREAGACIMMQSNAWRALEALGVANDLRSRYAMKVERMEAYKKSGQRLNSLAVADCEGGPHELRGLVRNNLQSTLAAQLPDGVIRTSAGVSTVSNFAGPVIELEDGTQIKAKVVIGADGVMSTVGASLGIPKPVYAGWSVFRGMTDFPEGLPDPAPAFRVILEDTSGLMVGTYPVSPTRAYYFVCGPAPEDYVQKCKDKKVARAELEKRVKGLPLAMEAVVAHTPDEHLYISIVGDRKVPAGEPMGRGCITVIGDAMHPTTPAIGQGGAMALEDTVEVAAALRDTCAPAGFKPSDMAAAFAAAEPAALAQALRANERHRTERCAPLVELAHKNAERTIVNQNILWVWLRDWYISTFGFNPKTQLEYTLPYKASVL